MKVKNLLGKLTRLGYIRFEKGELQGWVLG